MYVLKYPFYHQKLQKHDNNKKQVGVDWKKETNQVFTLVKIYLVRKSYHKLNRFEFYLTYEYGHNTIILCFNV